MSKHNLTEIDRLKTIEWVCQICHGRRLSPEILHLSVYIMDRFLYYVPHPIGKENLNLLAGTSFFLASKFDTSNTLISYSDLQQLIQDDLASIKKAETYVWSIIRGNMSFPNPYNFLRWYSITLDSADAEHRTTAKYLMEVYIKYSESVQVCQSKIAAAALYLGNKIQNSQKIDCYIDKTGYTIQDLNPIVEVMMAGCRNVKSYSFYHYSKHSQLAVSKAALAFANKQ